MFKANPDGMRMEPTPERVLSVCRLISHDSMSRDEVRKCMTLGINDEKEIDQINKSINVALEELSLIKANAENLILAVDPGVIASPKAFRRYVSARVFSAKDTTFHMFTKWLIAQNERIFALKSWEGLAKTCASEVKELAALHEIGLIKLETWSDSTPVMLYYVDGDPINGFTHISVKEAMAS